MLVALRLHIPPNDEMQFIELRWYYDNAIKLQKDMIMNT